jgi:hypothetical protein
MNAASKTPSIRRFVVHTFLWLPPCFALWYLIAPYHAAIAASFADIFVAVFKSGLVSRLEYPGSSVVFVTTIAVPAAPGQARFLAIEVNTLLYTYGLALFLALMLAARAPWRRLLLGAVALVPFQSWGIAFDFLAHVGVKLGPEISAQAGLLGWRAETIALCYQVGTLILPSLIPVVAWALSNTGFLAKLLSRDYTVQPPGAVRIPGA